MFAALFIFNPVARHGAPAKRGDNCTSSQDTEGTPELLLFSNNKNEANLILRVKPKEKEKGKKKNWCHEFHGINMKIKEEMQKEDKEIRISELLQILPVAVPVPKAACHFSMIRSRFSRLDFFLFVLESS